MGIQQWRHLKRGERDWAWRVVSLEIDGCCLLWVSKSTIDEELACEEWKERGNRENEMGEVKTINIHTY